MTAYHRLRIPASRGQGVTIHIWVHQVLGKKSGKMKGSIQFLFFLDSRSEPTLFKLAVTFMQGG